MLSSIRPADAQVRHVRKIVASRGRLFLMASSLAILQDIGDKKGPAEILLAFGYPAGGPDQLEHEIEEHA